MIPLRWVGLRRLPGINDAMTKSTVASQMRTLLKVPLFAGLSDAGLRRILKLSTLYDAPAGRVLVQPRVAGSGLFVIEEGTVLVEHRSGRVELGPGEFFGELALLTDRAHAARVRAKTAVRCLAIDRFAFSKLLLDEPKIAISMLEALAARFSKTLH